MRLPWLDVLKGAAMVAVVANHAILWPMRAGDMLSAVLYGAAFWTVAAYAAVSGYIVGLRPAPSSPWAFIRHRARQLLVPWLIWVAVYSLAPIVWKSTGWDAALPSGFDAWPWARQLLLGGGALWFLPVIFVAGAVAALLDARTRSWWPVAIPLALYVLVAGVAWSSSRSPLALGSGTFWAIAPLYVAAYWAGLRFARDGVPERWRRSAWVVLCVTTAMTCVVTAARAVIGSNEPMWLAYAAGVPGGCAALVLVAGRSSLPENVLTRSLRRIGVASLGVYLLHAVVLAPLMVGASVLLGDAHTLLLTAIVGSVAAVWLATLASERLRTTALGRLAL